MTARFISSADVAVGGLVTAGTVFWVQYVCCRNSDVMIVIIEYFVFIQLLVVAGTLVRY